jgi:CRP/FNR family cyclic AMP-dependent transcriptional regulator
MQLKQERDENRCDPEVLQRVRNRVVAWGIPETNADELLEHYSLAAFRRGAVICQRGTPSDLLYWVCDGLVEIGYPLGDGDRIVMRLSGPGDVFGPLSLPDSAGRLMHAFEVKARTGCQVAFITNEQVSRILLTLEPKILVRLLEKTFVFWAEHAQHSAKFLAMDFQQRLQWIFTYLAEHFGVADPRGKVLHLDLGHQDLAAMIGSSRPIVTQLIAKMLQSGKLERRGKHYVVTGGKPRIVN